MNRESNESLLKERAENYTFEQIDGLELTNKKLMPRLEEYLFSDFFKGRPCTLIGDYGCGKTFALIKVLSRGVFELDDFVPVMFAYKKTGDIEPLDPLLLAPSLVWERRLERFRFPEDFAEKQMRKRLLERSNAIVFDDFHYVCEAVGRGEYPSSILTDFLKDMLLEVEKEKRVIISSADQLSKYSTLVGDREFDRLLPRFGLHPGDRYARDVDRLASIYVPPLSFAGWKQIFSNLGIEADEVIQGFLYKCTRNPRAIVKFAKLFGGTITRQDLGREATRRLMGFYKKRPEYGENFFRLLFHLPSVSPQFGLLLKENLLKKEGIVKQYEKQLEKFEGVAKRIAARIRPPELEVHEPEKLSDPIYLIGAKYKEGPLGKKVVQRELDKLNIRDQTLDEFVSFIMNPQQYREFLDNLRKTEEKMGAYFERVLVHFDSLFDKIGAEWFPVEPSRIAFHDLLYGVPASTHLIHGLTRWKPRPLPPIKELPPIEGGE